MPPFTDAQQIAASAIETGLAFMTGDTNVSQADGLRLMEALQGDLEATLAEAKTKTAVAEVDTQELYDIPVFTPTAMTFADMAAADEANETADNVRHLSRRFQMLFDNVMFSEGIDDKIGAVRGLVDEFAMLMGETPTMEADPPEAPLGELHADGVAVEVARDATEADLSEVETAIETGRRAPVVVDFRMLQPGPGNKKHRRYYPADVLKRDIHVFDGADVYATDHIHKERNEETKKGQVLQCPAYFMEDGSPIGRVLIYDPYQAEKARNRADAGALDTLQCSIFGKGKATPGQVDGQNYSIVQEMTRGLYLDLVSSGGAGGQAQTLVESENGGETMNDTEEKTTPDADTEVTEVDIEESATGEAEPEADETPQPMLESEAIDTALAEVKLPKFVKAALSVGQYADTDALQEAVADAIAEVKKMTGSGNVVGLGESETPKAETLTVEEREQRATDDFNDIMREVGLSEVKQ